MNKRKLGIIRSEKKHRPEILEAYSLEQVCDMLNVYLSGEIKIRSDPRRTYISNINSNKPNAD